MTKNNSIDRLISLIFAVSRRIREHSFAHRDGDPHILHLETLRYIAEKKNPLMKEIASYLLITPPSATFLVNCLVKSGYLRRVYDERDRRQTRLLITADGRKALERALKIKRENIKKIFANLDKKEINDFIKILKKISGYKI